MAFHVNKLMGCVAFIVVISVILPMVFGNPVRHKDIAAAKAEIYRDITIPQGTLRGFTRKSRQGREFTAFYKVPYAEPPVGEFRFKDPIAPRKGWEGVRQITEVAPQCLQKDKNVPHDSAAGEEDCLYANIYIPNTNSSELLPTMVYIHGGGFTDGNGSRYGPEYFMDEDVVLLNFQYRLGPFGYLNSGDGVIRGNMGFKDQVQMLRWTKDSIRHFGGDPNRVTIFGNSAGAMSAAFHMLSPLSNGLFHGAITQSGASLCTQMVGLVDRNPERTMAEIAKELGCDATNSTRLLQCLQSKNGSDIAIVRNDNTVYGLTIENRANDQGQIFMPDTPYVILQNNPNRVPYIIGVVNAEMVGQALVILGNEDLVKVLNQQWDAVAGSLLLLNVTVEKLRSIKDVYFGNHSIGNETLFEISDMVSDRSIAHCSYVSALMHGRHSPAYLYDLTKPPHKSYADKVQPGFPAKEMGLVSHADELQYLFLYDGYPEITVDDEEYYEFSKYLVKTWATFARDGKPQDEWAEAGRQNETFWMELNDNKTGTVNLERHMQFWDTFTHQELKYVD